MATTTLRLIVDYDATQTDPEALAAALDTLLETALSTPGHLNDYGNPQVGACRVGRTKEHRPCRRRT